MKIILVDNEPAILRAMTRRLEKLGHKVVTMDDGAAAISYLSSAPGDWLPDAIICDYEMPTHGLAVMHCAMEHLPQWWMRFAFHSGANLAGRFPVTLIEKGSSESYWLRAFLDRIQDRLDLETAIAEMVRASEEQGREIAKLRLDAGLT